MYTIYKTISKQQRATEQKPKGFQKKYSENSQLKKTLYSEAYWKETLPLQSLTACCRLK